METVLLTLVLVFNGVEIKHTEEFNDFIGNRSTMFFCTNTLKYFGEAFKATPPVIITEASCKLTKYDPNAIPEASGG